jgi:hypothetical protein
MSWTTPEFVEIKMDAEIGAYQPDDFGDAPEVPFVVPAVAARTAED